ncbi:hypothetical protein GCM10009801_02130 [Streptomyces albiaxialis]|uniref:YCII-related domain-containing protein n=1 Tax=Streptomyces albiaxialis TaxID=329523 RepID=A0ABN2VF86_9ACTN
MLILELAFTAAPERLAARPAHRDVLARLRAEGRLLAAGPWEDDSGALLVFTVDRAELDRLMDDDPYYRTPGVEVVRIRAWSPVVGPPASPDPVVRPPRTDGREHGPDGRLATSVGPYGHGGRLRRTPSVAVCR